MKALREKKDLLLNKMESMLNIAEVETRALSDEEMTQYNELKAEVEKINATLKAFEEKFKEQKTEKTEDKGEQEDMKKEETRALEMRNMATGTYENAVPTELSTEVIKKLDELSNVVADVSKVDVVGDFEILVEKAANGKAQILGETDRLSATDLNGFDTVKLSDKRVATEVVVSEKLLNNSPIVSHEYVVEEVAKRVARTLEDEIFNSDGTTNHFGKGLISSVEATEVTKIDIDSIKSLVVSMNPTLLNGAKLYMNRTVFDEVSKLKDGSGQYYLQLTNVVNEGPQYMIFGVPVEITECITEKLIVLANVGQAYKLKVSADNMGVRTLTEKYSDVGCLGFIVNVYFDGAVVDKQAVKVLKTSLGRSK